MILPNSGICIGIVLENSHSSLDALLCVYEIYIYRSQNMNFLCSKLELSKSIKYNYQSQSFSELNFHFVVKDPIMIEEYSNLPVHESSVWDLDLS